MKYNLSTLQVYVCAHESDPFFCEGRSRTLWAAQMASAFSSIGTQANLCANLVNTLNVTVDKRKALAWIRDEVKTFYGCEPNFRLLDIQDMFVEFNGTDREVRLLITRSVLLAKEAVELGVNVVLEDHDEPIQKDFRGLYPTLLNISRFRQVVCVTAHIASLLKSDLGIVKKIDVLPSGVDLRKTLATNRLGKPAVVYMGGLHEERDVIKLFEASTSFPNCSFYIFGGRQKQIMEYLHHYRSYSNLFFFGFHRVDDIYRFLSSINPIFVYTRNEGSLEITSPLKLLEYLKSDCPIVAVNHDFFGIKSAQLGITTYSVGDVESLCSAIEVSLVKASSLSLSNREYLSKYRRNILKNFSWEARAKTMISYLGC